MAGRDLRRELGAMRMSRDDLAIKCADRELVNAELVGRLVAIHCAIERIRDVAGSYQECAAHAELNELLATWPEVTRLTKKVK